MAEINFEDFDFDEEVTESAPVEIKNDEVQEVDLEEIFDEASEEMVEEVPVGTMSETIEEMEFDFSNPFLSSGETEKPTEDTVKAETIEEYDFTPAELEETEFDGFNEDTTDTVEEVPVESLEDGIEDFDADGFAPTEEISPETADEADYTSAKVDVSEEKELSLAELLAMESGEEVSVRRTSALEPEEETEDLGEMANYISEPTYSPVSDDLPNGSDEEEVDLLKLSDDEPSNESSADNEIVKTSSDLVEGDNVNDENELSKEVSADECEEEPAPKKEKKTKVKKEREERDDDERKPSLKVIIAFVLILLVGGGVSAYALNIGGFKTTVSSVFAKDKVVNSSTDTHKKNIDSNATSETTAEQGASNPFANRQCYFEQMNDKYTVDVNTIIPLKCMEENLDFYIEYVVYENGSEIYKTDLIPSGTHVDWKPADYLSAGEHTITVCKTAYYDTDGKGNYASLLSAPEDTVEITVIK
jgi:hypothetical protein